MPGKRSAEDPLVARVAGLEHRVANVESETKAQTIMLDAIKENSETLVKQAIESAEERGRRKSADEERHARATVAETKLKTWQRYAIPIGIALAIISALLAHGVKP